MKWISVHKRLPENMETVLLRIVCFGQVFITNGCIDNQEEPDVKLWAIVSPEIEIICEDVEIKSYDKLHFLTPNSTVTHWMPIPEFEYGED